MFPPRYRRNKSGDIVTVEIENESGDRSNQETEEREGGGAMMIPKQLVDFKKIHPWLVQKNLNRNYKKKSSWTPSKNPACRRRRLPPLQATAMYRYVGK